MSIDLVGSEGYTPSLKWITSFSPLLPTAEFGLRHQPSIIRGVVFFTQQAFFLFTSKAGSTDHFHWFMDYIVGLFTSSVKEYALLNALLHMSVPFKKTWELKAMSRCQVARSRICSNTTVYVGVSIFALYFLSPC